MDKAPTGRARGLGKALPGLAPAWARALAWTTTRRKVILPVVFVVLVALNLLVALWIAPPFKTGVSLQIDPPDPAGDPDAPPPNVDTDTDGVSDLDELYLYGTDPRRGDTDGDGMPDRWEAEHRRFDAIAGDYTPDPVVADGGLDPDRDDLTNLEEYLAGTDPNDADVDGDGLPDGWEVKNDLDPLKPNVDTDTDGDGATDHEEFIRGTHPARLDSDLDGLPDARELELGTDAAKYDTTGSGVADGWLLAFGFDPLDPKIPYEDVDGDGMTTQEEFLWSAKRLDFTLDLGETEAAQNFRRGLDPTAADSDGDGAGDGWEVRYSLDPLAPGDGEEDLDGDGLRNLEEFEVDADPRKVDTDGDGLTDFDEARTGWKIRLDERDVEVFSDPSKRDSDGDGLSDPEEKAGFAIRNGVRIDFCPEASCPLNPLNPDTDLDGLADASEILYDVKPRLNPLVADTDGDGLPDGAEIRFWEERGRTLTSEEASRLGAERAATLGLRETPQQVRDQVGPTGDVDGDGVPNVVDQDSDGDKLADGAEVKPGTWRSQPGSDLRFPFPATDPLFRDSDGDGLVDAWEKEYARWDASCGLWNLDPSRVNSYLPCASANDGKTDGERDLDNDGVRYESAGYRERRTFAFTNLLEQAARTDPNEPDTDGDTITDGWEAYFTDLGRRLGVAVKLDPTNGQDANHTSKTLPYLRFVGSEGGAVEPRRNETILQVFSDIALPEGGSWTVVKIEGTHNVRYIDEFVASTDPTTPDTDGDGLPDAWEFLWSVQGGFSLQDSTSPFSPVVDTADKDPDQDTLTNLQEAEVIDAEGRYGLNPLRADTDLGGITDEKELGELGAEGPLDPRNDNLNLDADGDGLTNGEEAFQYRTSPSLPDSDRDGLLDGGNVDLDLAKAADLAKARRFDEQGVVARVLSNTVWRYFGEGKLDNAERTDPTKFDTDGDGLPDGWEIAYGLPAKIYTAGATSDSDPLDDSTEYNLGKPAGFDPRKVWWFGGDPKLRDTDGDGGMDGAIDRLGRVVGEDLDYDNDGLNDFSGEDPYPVYDHNNTGLVKTDDPKTMRGWVIAGARQRTHLLDKDGDRIPDVADQALAIFRNLEVTYPGAAGILPKGDAVVLTGKLVAKTLDGDKPVARAVVVANVDGVSGDASRVLGVAVTGADGSFSLRASALRDQKFKIPDDAGGVVLFGRARAAGEEVSWTLNTSLIQPKPTDRRLYLWNYGVSAVEGRYAFDRVACGDLRAAFAIECSTSFKAEGLRSGFSDATEVTRTLKIKTTTSIEIPAGGGTLRGENGGKIDGVGRLVDAVGDGIPDRTVTVSWRGENRTLLTKADGTFPIQFDTGTFAEPGLYPIEAGFIGDGDRVFESSTVTGKVAVAFDTKLSARVTNENLVVAAGSWLTVEGNLSDYRGRPVYNATVRVDFLGASAENLTSEDGTFRIRAPAPQDVLAGTQSVTVTFPGDDLHKKSELTRPIYVTVKQMTRIAIRGGDHSITAPLVIEGVLLDAGNQTVRDPTSREPLRVRITGPNFVNEATLNDNGVFSTVVGAETIPGVGSYGVRIQFTGSPLYAPVSETVEYRIVSTSAFELEPKRLPRGVDGEITGRLLDGRGGGIPSATVAVRFGERDLGTVLTDATGAFRATVQLPAAAELGPVRVRATYNGTSDGVFAAATPGQVTYHVVAKTRLILPARDVPTGEFTLNGSLVDDGGAPVGGEEVRITFDGREIARARTDFEGGFEVVVNPACLAVNTTGRCAGAVLARTYDARAVFDGTLVYAPAEAASKVRVLARTDIVLDHVSPVARGQDVFIRGRLLQEGDIPIARASILATLGGADRNVTIGRALTFANGTFEIQGPVPAGFARGAAPLRLFYAGNENRQAAEEVVIVDVVSPTRIQLKLPTRLGVGDAFTGTIVLVDDEGRPVPDAVIRVRFSGYAYPFTLKTNATGETSFPGKIVESGSSEVAVRFAGGGALLGATETSRIQVGAGGVLGVEGRGFAAAIAGALLAVAVASVFVARWRRRQAGEVRRILYDAESSLVAGDEYVATILTAYRRLSEHLVRYGYIPRPDVTSHEFADAARQALPIREGPLTDLVTLFDEARYSQHPVGPAERDAAVRALAAINRDLLAYARERAKGGKGAMS